MDWKHSSVTLSNKSQLAQSLQECYIDHQFTLIGIAHFIAIVLYIVMIKKQVALALLFMSAALVGQHS